MTTGVFRGFYGFFSRYRAAQVYIIYKAAPRFARNEATVYRVSSLVGFGDYTSNVLTERQILRDSDAQITSESHNRKWYITNRKSVNHIFTDAKHTTFVNRQSHLPILSPLH